MLGAVQDGVHGVMAHVNRVTHRFVAPVTHLWEKVQRRTLFSIAVAVVAVQASLLLHAYKEVQGAAGSGSLRTGHPSHTHARCALAAMGVQLNCVSSAP